MHSPVSTSYTNGPPSIHGPIINPSVTSKHVSSPTMIFGSNPSPISAYLTYNKTPEPDGMGVLTGV